ncbi:MULTISPECIES: stress response translation initiation inhibitor YciH [Idiomarina]|jgi:translation initiation factor 1|uniref:stress response translation initiation inhibitor YciH n=1 Tax=Idiomarina TaxID=135575 RepID=UPI0006C8581F|nr:stress response translation initiation inhibitor YciH [Idiomarina abyssalis]KPD22951.1 translation initiation factor Sui1 [Idiomarina abyssalis]MAL82794.1 translation initiation factor [Idiomarina sp.]MDA6065688.1 stress response translation initiation inhibitor YciH [Idiomarina abyssalis]SFT50661.1 translation initiation factor 1 (eIF-1/SUI1) [Idiomarina abyssalis]
MPDWKDQLSQVVYSTDSGRIDPEPEPESVPEGDGIVRLRRETKGRKGKGVTIVNGLNKPQAELKSIAKKLKQLCGVGGAVKEYEIELQGDQRDSIESWLKKEGYKVKRSGG